MFSRRIDDELAIELFHTSHTKELFLEVDNSRDHLRKWLDWVDDTKQLLDTREFLRLSMAGYAEAHSVRCGVRWRGRLCGSVSIEGISSHTGRGEIGYWLAADCTGNGIMTRCVRHLSDLAFDELELHRLEIHAAEGNHSSWAIPERLGWTLEGTKRQSIEMHGGRLDMRLYSLLASDQPTSQ